MNNRKIRYRGQDLALIIPTKDRSAKMRNLLDSLAAQSMQCGRIIVVNGGQSIRDIVMSFVDRLPVEYYECYPPGQIRQRNMAISKLDERTPLVASIDDDIVLESEALEAMINFWNKCEPETAGVSFNIVNNPPYRYSWIKSLFFMSSIRQGQVLISGYNVATTPVKEDMKTEWLSGGATVWRLHILKQFVHKEIQSRWAICEDVIFSYPAGKQFPLYVCADAKVRHEHIYDHTVKMKFRYYGRTVTLWRLYFVESHPELSRLFYIWMVLGQIAFRSFTGLILFQLSNLQYAFGQLEGLAKGLYAVMLGKSPFALLNE